MEKKIYRTICAIVLTAVFLFDLAALGICFHFYTVNAENELKYTAEIMATGDMSAEEIAETVNNAYSYDIRITEIAPDGTVVYDSEAKTTENHLNRPEVAEAFKSGSGHDRRYSETLSRTTYYYAVLRGDNVLRFSRQTESIVSVFVTVIPFFVLAAAVIVVVAVIVSHSISARIMVPINGLVRKMDVLDESPEAESVGMYEDYEELVPVIRKAGELSMQLREYITQLKREKDTIKLITANMVEGMILIDGRRNILSVNRSAVKMLNPYYPHDDKQRNIEELTRSAELLRLLDKSEELPSVTGSIEVGSRYYRVFISRADSEERSEQCGAVIMLVDETEIRRTEEIRRDFSANVSHELKTPLTTIKGFGEMLANGMISESGDVSKYGQRIFKESERLLQLINDIIRLSEIEEKTAAQLEEIDLFETAEECADILTAKAEANNITLSVSGEHSVIPANKSYLTEMIVNLADNSIKYNKPGGRVDIIISGGSCPAVTVKDNGIGIPEESRSRIFERFYRVDKSHSRQTGGTGLGLSIVKHIAAYHGGNVTLKSEVGKGTEITVTFPPKNQ